MEFPLLSHFVQVQPQPSNTFSHVLYVVHRDSMLAPGSLLVRRAMPGDDAQLGEVVGLRADTRAERQRGRAVR